MLLWEGDAYHKPMLVPRVDAFCEPPVWIPFFGSVLPTLVRLLHDPAYVSIFPSHFNNFGRKIARTVD